MKQEEKQQQKTLKKNRLLFPISLLCLLLAAQFASSVFSQTGSVSGIVLDKQTNTPIISASVFFYEPNLNNLQSTTTNSDGTFLAPFLSPGALQISVVAPGYAESIQAEYSLTEGQQISDVRILLPKEAQLTGKVMNSTGQPIYHAEIFAQSTDEKSSGFTVSASDGSFKVFGLDAGSFKVTIKSKGFLSRVVENVSLQNEQTGTLPNVQLQPAGRMTVDVLNSSGQAVPDAEITVEGGEVFRTAISRLDGKAEFPELPFGDYTVTIDSSGYILSTGSYNVTSYDPPTSVQAQLQKGASIVGHVYASDGVTAIEKVDVILTSDTGGGSTTTTLNDGSYSFLGLKSGVYQISLTFQDSYVLLDEKGINIVGAETKTVNFISPVTGIIKGKVFWEDGVTPAHNAFVYAKQTDGDQRGYGSTEVDATGEFTINELLPGTYKVRASLDQMGAQQVNVSIVGGESTNNINFILSASQ